MAPYPVTKECCFWIKTTHHQGLRSYCFNWDRSCIHFTVQPINATKHSYVVILTAWFVVFLLLTLRAAIFLAASDSNKEQVEIFKSVFAAKFVFNKETHQLEMHPSLNEWVWPVTNCKWYASQRTSLTTHHFWKGSIFSWRKANV